jgi:threonine aldolase
VAGLLDKEAALFIHKGVVAQQMALRVWTERTGRRTWLSILRAISISMKAMPTNDCTNLLVCALARIIVLLPFKNFTSLVVQSSLNCLCDAPVTNWYHGKKTRVWKTRLGGNLFSVFPYVLAALEGLHHHLPKMEAYVARAREVSAAIAEIPGVMIVPDPPQTNAFQIYLPAGCEGLRKAAEKLAETEHIWLFGAFEETHFPPLTMAEITIGDAAEQWTTEEIVAAMKTLLTYAQKHINALEIS